MQRKSSCLVCNFYIAMEREQSRSISLCVRKSTPLQTPEITPFYVFAIYNFYFPNIFVNILTFTNTDAVLLTVTVDNLILYACLHSFPVSERKSRNSSFSIFKRRIS